MECGCSLWGQSAIVTTVSRWVGDRSGGNYLSDDVAAHRRYQSLVMPEVGWLFRYELVARASSYKVVAVTTLIILTANEDNATVQHGKSHYLIEILLHH